MTVAKIEHVAVSAVDQIVNRSHVRISQIAHMNVIADTCTIRSLIIVSKDGDGFTLPQRRLQNQWNQVALRTMVLTDFTALMRAGSIKITQGNIFDAEHFIKPRHHSFHSQLGFTIHVGRIRSIALINGYLFRLPVSSCCGGEHDFSYISLIHRFQQTKRAVYIIVVVLDRVLHAFPNQ
ncbi:hypothetical protein D3C81_1447680 [compost metagenome]